MGDNLTVVERSRCMRAIRSKDTKPELLVRSLVHRMGFRFRLHAADLPGKPDLVFRSRRAVIFVHGCYWHHHRCKKGTVSPQTNAEFWRTKRTANVVRDRKIRCLLRRNGWRMLIVWECELRQPEKVAEKINVFLQKLGRN